MAALTSAQLELLRRAAEGLPMWGGSVATERLRREVDLLFALQLIEPTPTCSYQLTARGAQALEAHRMSLADR